MTRGRWFDVLWLLALGAASSAWCLSSSARLGATFDEPFYLDKGLHHWRTGSYKPLMTAGTMPLPVDLQTLPVYLWERQRGEAFHAYWDQPRILPTARAANLVFWWLLLGYGLALGRALGGPWAGRIAAAFLACEPSLLAHAALATTDSAVTAGVLAAAYHFHAGQDRGWWLRVFVPGLCYGIAILAKASALAFVPLVWVAFALHRLGQEGVTPCKLWAIWRASSRLRWDLVASGIIGIATVFVYCGSDWDTEPTFVAWAANLPDGPVKSVVLPVSENLRIFTNAGEGLVQQVKHNFRGHGSYLAGVRSPRAIWYYFPVLLSAKLTLPVLGLLAVVLVSRPQALAGPAGLAALALLLFSLNCRVQIGIRLMFPLVALLLVALAVAVCRRPNPPAPFPAREGGESQSPSPPQGGVGEGFFPALTALALAAMAGIAVWVWPHGICYTNSLWGGTADGWHVASDSNYDWGQGLPELKQWHEAHGDGRGLPVWYYGADPAVLLPPFYPVLFHYLPVASVDDIRRHAGTGYLAVCLTLLTGGPARTPSAQAVLDWLATQEPVGRTTTFVIYDLGNPAVR